ncbi:MAG TPA: 2'-5' RNA ligase family protein [Chryseosolibacter sp.]|nr:2'-5' RNA ligase family protein [Chryseosolibacter sp.]
MPKLNDDTQKLYFIALIPPSPVYEEAVSLKTFFKENYNSKASLNSPPHITLHMPFRWKEKKEAELITTLGNFIKQFDPQKICLDNFGAFVPKVIFINVATSEILTGFQRDMQRFCRRELNLFNANYKEQPFHPHLTLAFRDLKKHAFLKAWEEFKDKEYKAEFIADRIALLKHTGKVWQVYREFTLESSYSTENKGALDKTEG